MLPSHSPQQSAIASQLVEELDAYDLGLTQLLERRWDPELYRMLCDRFDRLQMFAHSLPRLANAWTELVISRVELAQSLWTTRSPSRINGKVIALHAVHRARIREVRAACAPYLPPAVARSRTATAR